MDIKSYEHVERHYGHTSTECFYQFLLISLSLTVRSLEQQSVVQYIPETQDTNHDAIR